MQIHVGISGNENADIAAKFRHVVLTKETSQVLFVAVQNLS